MIVWKCGNALDFGALPVVLEPIRCDWWKQPVEPAPGVALVEDPDHLWLLAGGEGGARPHPAAGCGDFVEGLWEHDVAEMFIAGPEGYLEFNLSPAGAWWAARFSAPRVRDERMGRPQVITRAHHTAAGWLAALGVPLDALRQHVGWDEKNRINVTMIVGSPQQFLTVADLGEGAPDFHRPDGFDPIEWRFA